MDPPERLQQVIERARKVTPPPRWAFAYRALADALIHGRCLAESVKPLEKCRELLFGDVETLETLGRVYRQLGKPEQAQAVLTEAYQRSPSVPRQRRSTGLPGLRGCP